MIFSIAVPYIDIYQWASDKSRLENLDLYTQMNPNHYLRDG